MALKRMKVTFEVDVAYGKHNSSDPKAFKEWLQTELTKMIEDNWGNCVYLSTEDAVQPDHHLWKKQA